MTTSNPDLLLQSFSDFSFHSKKQCTMTTETFEFTHETTCNYFIKLIKSGLKEAYDKVIKDSNKIVNEFLVTDTKHRYIVHLFVTEKLKEFVVCIRNITAKKVLYKESVLPVVTVNCYVEYPPSLINQMNSFKNYVNLSMKQYGVYFYNLRPFLFQKMNGKGIDSSYIAKNIILAGDSLNVIVRYYTPEMDGKLFYIFDGEVAVLMTVRYISGVVFDILEITANNSKIELYKEHFCIRVGDNHV